MDSRIKMLPKIFLAVALVCFLMPFLDLSCGEQKIISLTGFEMVTGKTVASAEIYGEQSQTHSQPLVILAILCAISGLALSFIKKNYANLICSILCFLGFVFLMAFKLKIDGNIAEKGSGMLFAEWRYGFIVACSSYVLACITSLVLAILQKNSLKS